MLGYNADDSQEITRTDYSHWNIDGDARAHPIVQTRERRVLASDGMTSRLYS